MTIDIILGDVAYDAKECLIKEFEPTPGANVRRNPLPKARLSSARKRAVVQQRKDYEA